MPAARCVLAALLLLAIACAAGHAAAPISADRSELAKRLLNDAIASTGGVDHPLSRSLALQRCSIGCAQLDRAWAVAALENARAAADTIKVRRTKGDLLEDIFVQVLTSVVTSGLMSAYVSSLPYLPGGLTPAEQATWLQIEVLGLQLSQNPWSALGLAAGQFPVGSVGRSAFQGASAWQGVTSVSQSLAKDPSLTLQRDLMRMEIVAAFAPLDLVRASAAAGLIEDPRPAAIAFCRLAAARPPQDAAAAAQDFDTSAAKARAVHDPAVRAVLLAELSQAVSERSPDKATGLREEATACVAELSSEAAADAYGAVARALSPDGESLEEALLLKAREAARAIRDPLRRTRVLIGVASALGRADAQEAAVTYQEAADGMSRNLPTQGIFAEYTELAAALCHSLPGETKKLAAIVAGAIPAATAEQDISLRERGARTARVDRAAVLEGCAKRARAALAFSQVDGLDAASARKLARALVGQCQDDEQGFAVGESFLAAAAIIARSSSAESTNYFRKGVARSLPALLELARSRADLTVAPATGVSATHERQMRPLREAEPWWRALSSAAGWLAIIEPSLAQELCGEAVRSISEADAKQGLQDPYLPPGYIAARAAVSVVSAAPASVQEMADSSAQPFGLWTPFVRISLAAAKRDSDLFGARDDYLKGLSGLPPAGVTVTVPERPEPGRVGAGRSRRKGLHPRAIYEAFLTSADPMAAVVGPGLDLLQSNSLADSERVRIAAAMRETINSAPWLPTSRTEALTRLSFSLLGLLPRPAPSGKPAGT